MRRPARSILGDTRGGPAAEFALVLPVMLMFLLGIIDVGRLMWTWNRAEKATQMGVRYAVATEIIPTALAGYSFAASGGIPQGDPIPDTAFGGIQCTSNGTAATCTCNTSTCGPSTLIDDQTAANTRFANIVARMAAFMPEITASRVRIDYGYSGLGYAGDPNGSDVAPLVTVRLRNMTFRPLLLMLFGGSITLPDFRAALTLEDGSGTVSN
ncbi:TadE/TadG family type IV pilus assembly protein [Sphingomonas sp. LaA6.9]|uniref:TadE/TadG family type IV pilus assembly protein n=1 Tax=Sphingomonas sp. LaA6.9 TaxID=2919914 RepID=UPI001F4F9690|nr:TadE family protein [Sphingomonas sp. LaA6.9]MCJ8158063.1 pilus assembly protein [Sphingomonas sp. LaA6.9]